MSGKSGIEVRPDWVLVYGDTDSTLAGALAAVKLHIPVAHVEAGLRSFNRQMPEEINRVLTDHVSSLLFVPTTTAVKNLENEGIKGEKVSLVGDVMYDATLFYRDRALKPSSLELFEDNHFILSTVHRAENTDNPKRLLSIVQLLNKLAEDRSIVLPLHPRTLAAIKRLDGVSLSSHIEVIEPVGFLGMTWLLANCELVITDSGGVQKEAYFHKKPCVTLRDETEWVELVQSGFNVLLTPLSIDVMELVTQVQKVTIPTVSGLYGDGDASVKILSILGI